MRWSIACSLLAPFSLVACGSAGSGGTSSDAGAGLGGSGALGGGAGLGGSGALGGSAGLGSGGSAGSSLADAGADSPPPIDQACELQLDPIKPCKLEQATSTPTLGGVFPDGVYDRVAITSPLPPTSVCYATSALLISNGIFKLQFDDLGGPFISGGSFVADSAAGKLTWNTVCGDPLPSYSYE